MTHYIETQTQDGATIRIEVEDTTKPATGFTRPVTSTNVSGETAKDVFVDFLQTIKGCAGGVIDTLGNLDASPSNASVDFSVKIDAEAGPMIAKSRDEGQFRVSVSWKQPEAKKEED